MPVYVKMVKDKKTGQKVEKIVNSQKLYYIRTYVKDQFGKIKQIRKFDKSWLGRDGYWRTKEEEIRLKNQVLIEKRFQETITPRILRDLYLESIADKIDPDTLKDKKYHLRHFCEIDDTKQVDTYPDEDINLITKEMYQKWQRQMKHKKYLRKRNYDKDSIFEKLKENGRLISIRHLNKINNTIIEMIEFGVSEGLCKTNFAKQAGRIGSLKEIKMSKAVKPWEIISYDEYKRLLEVSKDDLRFNTYFDLVFSRGPRPGEIRAFKIKDFNSVKKQLMVEHTMSHDNTLKLPKTAASKAPIDLDDSLCEKIKNLINLLREKEGFNEDWYLFSFNGPTPISSHALDYNKDKYFKLAGIKQHIRLHDFRHSCASWLFSIGIPIQVVSKIMRHANINETLKTYAHLLEEDYEVALEDINNYKLNNETRHKTRQKFSTII